MDAWEPPYYRPDQPSPARTHNALLGGWNHTEADKALAAELTGISPAFPQLALDSRLFTARAVGWAADQGIRQVIDLGAGLPPGEAVHEMARAILPDARVVYLDHDAEVCGFLDCLLPDEDREGIAVVNGDLRNPEAVMSDPGLQEVIDLAEPVVILATWILPFMPAAQAREVVAGYARLIAPGSYVVISCGRCDDEALWKQFAAAYTAADLYNHSPAEITGFLDGLELVPPGLAVAQGWRGGWRDARVTPPGPAYVLAGAALKPH